MVREGLSDVPLVVESAQVFDTHHVALLWPPAPAPSCPILRISLRNPLNRAARKKSAQPSMPDSEKFSPAWASPPWPVIATAIS